MADFDFSEFDRLAADIDQAARSARPNIRKALEVTARNVKDTWREKLTGSQHLPGLPSAVSYDVDQNTIFGVDILRAEIGFDKARRQGALGNISEYGSPTVAPRGYGHAALEENQEDFVRGVEIAVGDALKDNDL